MTNLPTLYLLLCRKYFEQISAGEKLEEYRKVTPYWITRIQGREFSAITLTSGYPKRDDNTRRMICAWRGYTKKVITHPHFGDKPVMVLAIDVSDIVMPANRAFARSAGNMHSDKTGKVTP